MSTIHDDRLLVKVARLYFENDLTQLEIGNRLKLSRQKVQRLLRQAREEGVVQIGIRPIMGIYAELEQALEVRFGLREAVVVTTADHSHQPTVAREIGVGAAEYLLRVVSPKDQIVISWGGSLLGMVNALSHNPRVTVENITVIQGLGGSGDPNHEAHAAELTRRVAQILGGEALLLPAPGVAGSRSARNAFYKDHYVSRVLDRARKANLAFMGIGAPRPDSILVQDIKIVTWPELADLMAGGAVGDINLRYFDERGQAISSNLDDRVIGLTLKEIKQIDHVVGVAGGAAKLKAIQGALRGKLIDVLITDHVTAQQLLKVESDSGERNGF